MGLLVVIGVALIADESSIIALAVISDCDAILASVECIIFEDLLSYNHDSKSFYRKYKPCFSFIYDI